MKKVIRKIVNHIYFWLGHDCSFWTKTPSGEWHHVCIMIRLGKKAVVYLDGVCYGQEI